MEKLAGSFEAKQPNLWTADVQFRIFVADTRMVAVRTGGQFAGHNLYSHFGLLGALFYQLFVKKRAEARKAEQGKQLETSNLDDLLTRHEKNFELSYSSLERASLKSVRYSAHGQAVAKLTLEPTGKKPISLLIQSKKDLGALLENKVPELSARLTIDPKLMARMGR